MTAAPPPSGTPRSAAGLYTPAEAATYLTISTKTLFRHVRDGAIRYIIIGRGTKKQRRAFDQSDLDAFKDARRRQMIPREEKPPCPSTSRRGGKNTSMTSGTKVVDFMDLLAAKGEKL